MKNLDNILVIGIGNNTRQDDGLGWYFIMQLENSGFNSENLICKYQLMVEDAALIEKYKTVYFVDAYNLPLKNGFKIEQIEASKQFNFSTHSIPPNQVLHLTNEIFNKKTNAYLIKIQGYKWDIKIGLTPEATINLNKSVKAFKLFLSN